MQPNPAAQRQAHDLFFQSGLSTAKIAEILSVNRKTVYHWMVKNKWREIKKATLQTPLVLVQDYYAQLAALNKKIAAREDAFPTKQEADIIRKLSMTIKQIKISPALSEVVETMALFIDDIRAADNDLAMMIVSHADRFVQKRVQKRPIDAAYQRQTEICTLDEEEKKEQRQEEQHAQEALLFSNLSAAGRQVYPGNSPDNYREGEVITIDNEVIPDTTSGPPWGHSGVTQTSQPIDDQEQMQTHSPQQNNLETGPFHRKRFQKRTFHHANKTNQ